MTEENVVELEIPTELYEELAAAASKLDMSLEEYCTEAILRGLKKPLSE